MERITELKFQKLSDNEMSDIIGGDWMDPWYHFRRRDKDTLPLGNTEIHQYNWFGLNDTGVVTGDGEDGENHQ
jgi:bacteriocin-like protein